MSIQYFLQIVADVIKILFCALAKFPGLDIAFREINQRMILKNGVTGCNPQALNRTAMSGADNMLHLHGFHNEDRLTDKHRVTLSHIKAHHRALHGGLDGGGAGRQVFFYQRKLCGCCCACRSAAVAVLQYRQRIVGELSAREGHRVRTGA